MLKRTPLFEIHKQLNGRMVEFGGWDMPVQYTGIIDEHLAVRKTAGIFDISHMGEVMVSGKQAEAFLNQLLTNDISKLTIGLGQYTLMCHEQGGVIDDLYAYRLSKTVYFLIINASRIDPDWQWIQDSLAKIAGKADVQIQNVSDSMGAVAVQGPNVVQFIDRCFSGPAKSGTKVEHPSFLKKNEIAEFTFQGRDILISRTGYTGEDGFEIVAPADLICAVWTAVMEAGNDHGLVAAGLGARDTLRTEVCYPLYGHELDEQTTPIEAGVGFFVTLDKPSFSGRTVLAAQKSGGVSKKCVAFKMTDKSAPPRPHYPIWMPGDTAKAVGEVVSGTQSPSLNVGIGMGYVPTQFAKAGMAIEIEIRGRRYPAVIVAKPIYRKTVA